MASQFEIAGKNIFVAGHKGLVGQARFAVSTTKARSF